MRRKMLGVGGIVFVGLSGCIPDDLPWGSDAEDDDGDTVQTEELTEDDEDNDDDRVAELEAENSALEEENADLESQITDLRAELDQLAQEQSTQQEDPEEAPGSTSEDVESAEVGEPVRITDWGETLYVEEVATMTLNSIEVGYTNPECYDQALNDHYIALNLTVEADGGAYQDVVVSQFNFYLLDENNTVYRDEAQTFEAYDCAFTAGALDWVPPGTNHTGYILLDTDLTEGTIVYEGVGEDIRWDF